MSSDSLTIADKTFHSRLIVGTGKYPSNQVMAEAHRASGTEMVTVAVRRVNLAIEAPEVEVDGDAEPAMQREQRMDAFVVASRERDKFPAAVGRMPPGKIGEHRHLIRHAAAEHAQESFARIHSDDRIVRDRIV